MLKRSIAEIRRLIEVATGRGPADYYLANGRIVNVYSGEVIEANVATSGERIAYVGSSGAMVGSGDEGARRGGRLAHPGVFRSPYAYRSPL